MQRSKNDITCDSWIRYQVCEVLIKQYSNIKSSEINSCIAQLKSQVNAVSTLSTTLSKTLSIHIRGNACSHPMKQNKKVREKSYRVVFIGDAKW